MTQLTGLSLQGNRLRDGATIPTELALLTRLSVLAMHGGGGQQQLCEVRRPENRRAAFEQEKRPRQVLAMTRA